MKNWKDKVLGIFTGIGIMVLLMGNKNVQNRGNGYYQMEIYVDRNGDQTIYLLDTSTGQVFIDERYPETISDFGVGDYND